MKTAELKPCPFCGSDPKTTIHYDTRLTIYCGCGMCQTASGSNDELDVVAQWNTRPNQLDALQQGRIEGAKLAAHCGHPDIKPDSDFNRGFVAGYNQHRVDILSSLDELKEIK